VLLLFEWSVATGGVSAAGERCLLLRAVGFVVD
jgi:hypothetical protein